ncbi:MAG: cupin domain-containing protein [Armatimonadetes bacterium]|nr:cupin domain-containing protein [Armatimonadota bacterium]
MSGTVPHHRLFESTIGPSVAGKESKVFHLDDVPDLASDHDRRRKKVLFNSALTGTEMLVDVLFYAPGGTSPLHYHSGTEHYFVVLDGRGHITINGQDQPLRAGSVVWLAEGDPHKVFAAEDSPLVFLEYFSKGKHETVFVEQACEWRPERRE